jgi:hypothetical protein
MNPALLAPLTLATVDVVGSTFIFALAAMVAGLLFAGYSMYLAHRRRVLWHETARLALEKGMPVPPDPDSAWSGATISAVDAAAAEERMQRQRRRGHIMGGLLNLAVGAGLYVALLRISPESARFAAVPFFIGVAFLLAGVIETLLAKKPTQPGIR